MEHELTRAQSREGQLQRALAQAEEGEVTSLPNPWLGTTTSPGRPRAPAPDRQYAVLGPAQAWCTGQHPNQQPLWAGWAWGFSAMLPHYKGVKSGALRGPTEGAPASPATPASCCPHPRSLHWLCTPTPRWSPLPQTVTKPVRTSSVCPCHLREATSLAGNPYCISVSLPPLAGHSGYQPKA